MKAQKTGTPASGPATRLVYSTEGGRTCPDCARPQAQCVCRAAQQSAAVAARASADGHARVGRHTQGRAGKVVTVVRGLALDDAALAALGKQLRQLCGSGGSVKDGRIEIQGEHLERVLAWLHSHGYRAKLGH